MREDWYVRDLKFKLANATAQLETLQRQFREIQREVALKKKGHVIQLFSYLSDWKLENPQGFNVSNGKMKIVASFDIPTTRAQPAISAMREARKNAGALSYSTDTSPHLVECDMWMQRSFLNECEAAKYRYLVKRLAKGMLTLEEIDLDGDVGLGFLEEYEKMRIAVEERKVELAGELLTEWDDEED